MKQFDQWVRSSALTGFQPLVQALKGDPEAILYMHALSLNDLKSAENKVEFSAYTAVLESSADILNCTSFGLQLANKQDIRVLGSVGLVMARCATVKEALACATRYITLHAGAEYWCMETQEDQHIVTRFQHQDVKGDNGQSRELSLALCYSLLKQLVGPDFRCSRVSFSHKSISSREVYQHFFSGQVQFNQEKDQIIFPKHFLFRPLKQFDSQVKMQLEAQLEEQIALSKHDIETQVRNLVFQTIGSQEHSIDNIANLLAMHPRTLQRRLRQKGLSFNGVVNDVRRESACWLLRASDMDITLMAHTLGYSTISAFSKAFSQCFGCSPSAWRDNQRHRIAEPR